MNSSVRNAIIIVLPLVLVPVLFFKSCIIQNTQPSDCKVVSAKIVALKAYPSLDIGFRGDQGERFYINRGVEFGLNLDSLNAKVLNKTVTLHLPKLLFGVTRHIAHLEIDGQILYSEFKN
ncbi:hypothetical protein HNV08_03505 [Winogradskyella eckloniae]|uniref:hypothetical protein n=1 Tax=Winogradskyella eckloniae TaxID=1089306 RepID=UPI001564F095|nr:hypothetical protein [Winogradskyella eckloniae]NRD19102.1 hypothetical protein [Winogradskyella eckloniae]